MRFWHLGATFWEETAKISKDLVTFLKKCLSYYKLACQTIAEFCSKDFSYKFCEKPS